jgi:hypothetical protein
MLASVRSLFGRRSEREPREPAPPDPRDHWITLLDDGSFLVEFGIGEFRHQRFHGYDVVLANGRRQRLPSGSIDATHRIFVVGRRAACDGTGVPGRARAHVPRGRAAALRSGADASMSDSLNRQRPDHRDLPNLLKAEISDGPESLPK